MSWPPCPIILRIRCIQLDEEPASKQKQQLLFFYPRSNCPLGQLIRGRASVCCPPP